MIHLQYCRRASQLARRRDHFSLPDRRAMTGCDDGDDASLLASMSDTYSARKQRISAMITGSCVAAPGAGGRPTRRANTTCTRPVGRSKYIQMRELTAVARVRALAPTACASCCFVSSSFFSTPRFITISTLISSACGRKTASGPRT